MVEKDDGVLSELKGPLDQALLGAQDSLLPRPRDELADHLRLNEIEKMKQLRAAFAPMDAEEKPMIFLTNMDVKQLDQETLRKAWEEIRRSFPELRGRVNPAFVIEHVVEGTEVRSSTQWHDSRSWEPAFPVAVYVPNKGR